MKETKAIEIPLSEFYKMVDESIGLKKFEEVEMCASFMLGFDPNLKNDVQFSLKRIQIYEKYLHYLFFEKKDYKQTQIVFARAQQFRNQLKSLQKTLNVDDKHTINRFECFDILIFDYRKNISGQIANETRKKNMKSFVYLTVASYFVIKAPKLAHFFETKSRFVSQSAVNLIARVPKKLLFGSVLISSYYAFIYQPIVTSKYVKPNE
jgi:hypothetical protein